jgi:hypothetical protein
MPCGLDAAPKTFLIEARGLVSNTVAGEILREAADRESTLSMGEPEVGVVRISTTSIAGQTWISRA